MRAGPPPELRFRLGCPLALLITAALLAGVEAITALNADRPLRIDLRDFGLFPIAFIGAPFAALAVARARDWLAWLVGIVMTVAAWALMDLAHDPGEGVNFSLGLAFLFTPFAIAGAALATAGIRGRIGWAREGDRADD